MMNTALHSQIKKAGILAILIFSLMASITHARTWTSADGSKTFEGELKSYDAQTRWVYVTMANGRTMNFHQNKLSKKDIEWLKQNAGSSSGGSSKSSGSRGGNKVPEIMPGPDGKAPNTSKPIKVYFLSGQSNMVGMGRHGQVKELAQSDKAFGYLIDDSGNFTTRSDVHYINHVMDKQVNNCALGVVQRKIGPEVGIGHVMGYFHDEQVLIIKGSCGNRSLHWDFMPPSARERLGQPMQGEGWYAGTSYDRYIKQAQNILANIGDYVPNYQGQGYEMAGFFWWQGHKDKGKSKKEYQELLGELIRDFRKDLGAAKDAPFVVCTVAFNGKNLGAWQGVFNAQMGISKESEFKGNVASVDIRDIGGGGFHYGDNGATYAKVGDRMGRAMAELMSK